MSGNSEYTRFTPDIETNLSMTRHMRTTYQAMWDTRKPVIAKIHGYCIAGGCYLQMLCDVSVAADDARLGHPRRFERRYLAMPLWNWYLGIRKAKELLLTGKLIDGREAARIGLVNESVPRDELNSAVDRWASEMASLPMDSLLLCKESLNIAADVMGLSATSRTHAAMSALARMSPQVDVDLEAQRSRAASRIAAMNDR
jgi:enoyl-CoA hydratase